MITKHRKRARLPQAPRTRLPELAEFLAPLRVHFTQGPSAETLRQYLTGLLSEHPNKNCDTLAAVVAETNEQQFNHLLTDMVWDENALNRQRIARMQTLASEGDGVLIFDDTGFEKRGHHSVGVARQYTGTAGKVTNCQVTVNCHYAERTLAWPVATRLYLPQAWTADEVRRQQAHVPAAVRFQAKAELALALLDEAKACGVRYACVTCDADYGDNPNFLNGLEQRGERYVVAVRADFSVTLGGWPQNRARTGRLLRGAQGSKAGGGPSFARYAAGGWMVMAAAISAGCWGNAPVAASTGIGSIAGVISRPPHHWPGWSNMPTAVTGSSSIMKKPKPSWAGISIKDGAGMVFIATPSA